MKHRKDTQADRPDKNAMPSHSSMRGDKNLNYDKMDVIQQIFQGVVG